MDPDRKQINIPKIERENVVRGWQELLGIIDQIDLSNIRYDEQGKIYGAEKFLKRARKLRTLIHDHQDEIAQEPQLKFWLGKVWLAMLADAMRLIGLKVTGTVEVTSMQDILDEDVKQIFGIDSDNIPEEAFYHTDAERCNYYFSLATRLIKGDAREAVSNDDYFSDYVTGLQEDMQILGILSQGVPYALRMIITINTALKKQQVEAEKRANLFVDKSTFTLAWGPKGGEKLAFISQERVTEIAAAIKREYIDKPPTDKDLPPLIVLCDEIIAQGITMTAVLKKLQTDLDAIQLGFGDIALSRCVLYGGTQKWTCHDEGELLSFKSEAAAGKTIDIPKTNK